MNFNCRRLLSPTSRSRAFPPRRACRNRACFASGLLLAFALAAAFHPGPLAAQPPEASEPAETIVSGLEMLPATTGGYVRVVDMPALCSAWDETNLSQLTELAEMQPFWEAQQAFAKKQLLAAGVKVGLRLPDLYEMSSGEVVVGWLTFRDPKRPYSVCLITDIRGRREQAEQALATLDQSMQQREAQRTDQQYAGRTLRVYTLPKQPGQFIIDRIAVTLDQNQLIASDRIETLQQLLDRADGNRSEEGLEPAPEHAAIWQHVGRPEATDVQWFARPLPLARIIRELAGSDRGRQVDVVNLLDRQGFSAVQSAGGRVQVSAQRFDLLHHGFIYAPGEMEGDSRFKLAARMLDFPNSQMGEVPGWVDPRTSSCLRLNWKMEEAFWAAETLVNDAFGSDVFRPTLKGMREDDKGAKIDIANNVVAHFDDRLYHITDNTNAAGDRLLVAIRLNEYDPVAKSVNRAMEFEPNAERFEDAPDHPIWRVIPEAEEVLDEDTFGDFGFEDDVLEEDPNEGEANPPLLEQWAITVAPAAAGEDAAGYLMFASHADLLAETVDRIRNGSEGSLNEQPGVQSAFKALRSLSQQPIAGYRINRLKRSLRLKYQALRAGTLRDSDSILGSLIRRAAEEAQNPEMPEGLDFGTLPDFEVIEPYLMPAGGMVHSEDDGWRIRGFLLRTPETNETSSP